MTHAQPTPLERAWTKLAPKLVAFLAGGGLTAAALISAYTWVSDLLGWQWQLQPALAALLVGAVATIAGWWKSDGALYGLAWNDIAPKLLTLAVSSGLITTTVLVLAQFGVEVPAWIAAAAAVILPAIPGYFVKDNLALAA